MSNPLVAEAKDDTKAYTGIPLLESVNDTAEAIEKGDWAAGVLGAVGTAMDAASMAMDPFGAILASGVGWLMEHVGPLKEALDALAGDPDEIKAHSETWKNIAGELESISGDLKQMVTNDTASWTGPGGDSYRKRGEDTATLVTAAQSAASGASEGVGTAGTVVDAVRTLVRDIIAELVGHMISWALQVVFTLGIGMAWVVPQVITAVAKTAAKIADITMKLVKAMKALSPLLKKLGDGFDEASKALKNIKSSKPPAPDKPNDKPRGGGGDTGPSGAKPDGNSYKGPDNNKPDGNTTPSSDKGPDTTPSSGKGPDTTPNSNKGPEGNTSPSSDKGPETVPNSNKTPEGNPPGNSNKTPEGNTTPNSKKPDPPRKQSVPAPNRNTCGDPVDIATGEMVMAEVDLELPGLLRLLLERTHVSSYRAGEWFGPSWASTVDQRLEIDDTDVCYFSPDGMVLVYPRPAVGTVVLPVEGPRFPLRLNEDGTFTLTDVSLARTLHFGERHGNVLPLLTIRDGSDQRVDFEYEAGIPAVLRHSAGMAVGIRTERNRVTEIRVLGDESTPDVVVMGYRYNERGQLTEVVNSAGAAARFDYDAEGRMTGWQDRNGVWYRYVYDEYGRCVRTVGAEGYLDGEFTYDRERLVTTFTNSLGHTTVYQLNEANQTVRETDPLGHSTLFEWDRYDRLLSRTDQFGNLTRYDYDPDGRPSRVIRPDGSVVELESDGARVTAIAVHGPERSWRRYYDSAPDPLREQVGVATELQPGEGNDAEQVMVGDEVADVDLFGRLRSVPDADGGRIRLGWTVEGKQSWRMGPRQERRLWRYDHEGNNTEHVDELGRVTRHTYGAFGLLTATVDPVGGRTMYSYDTEFQLMSVTNPAGLVWTYKYDPLGRMVEQTDFDGRVRRYAYDAAGRLVRTTDPAGAVTEYRYDVLGNLVGVAGPSTVTAYAYDPVGLPTRVSNQDSTVEFERDQFGRVVSERVDGREVTFTYDSARNCIRRCTPSGAVSEWVFDAFDRPLELATHGHTVRYEYDLAGRPVARQVDGLSVLRQSFGPGGRLTLQELTAVGSAPTPVQRRTFDYHADGRLAALTDSVLGRTEFKRDAAARITAVTTGADREVAGYDRAGNLAAWSFSGVGEAETGPARYERNSVVALGAVTFTYDRNGRRITRREARQGGVRVWQYAWDDNDRLVGVITPEGRQWRYRYDPLGRRTAKERLRQDGIVAESVEFVWDGAVLIEQTYLDHSTGLRRVTTWERRPDDRSPVTQLERGPDGERFHSFVTDAIGTPTELVDEQGRLAWYGRRTLWGRELPFAGASATTPLRFPGQYADVETGLHYNVFRYYDPATARYLSQDPLGLAAGPNPVAYTDDPILEFDALGLMCTTRSQDGSLPQPNPNGGHNPGQTGGSATPAAPPKPPPFKDPAGGPKADELVTLGRYWNSQVWMQNGSRADTNAFLDGLPPYTKIGLGGHGIEIKPGWQPYDPVVTHNGKRPTSYNDFVNKVTGDADGGKSVAADLSAWANGSKKFHELPPHAQDMAVISHFAESGRGYTYDVANFDKKMGEIANMSPDNASAAWKDMGTWFPPKLKYKEDTTGPAFDPGS